MSLASPDSSHQWMVENQVYIFSSKEPVFQSILSFNHKTLLEYQETDLSPNKPK
jgi:hypothetical protein